MGRTSFALFMSVFSPMVRLYGVKDNQPRPVLRDCLFYALVGEGKLPLGFINHKHAVKVGFGFYQAGLAVSPSPSSAVW